MPSLTFLGGVGTVTGSRYLVDCAGKQVLVDCGLFQGGRQERERNWTDPPFRPSDIQAVVLTHAHMDHSGALPRLAAHGFRGPIYCSRGTAALLKILLPDGGRLQEEEAEYRNKHGLSRHQPALPLYTEQDAMRALTLVRPITEEGAPIEVAPGFQAAFYNAGHLLGSRFVLATLTEAGKDRTVLFSGDLGRNDRPILRDLAPPPDCDTLLIESTYGGRAHSETDPVDQLADAITAGVRRGGPILIPAFAIGRTQDILYAIRELEDAGRIPSLHVFVDSPMANAATTAYEQLVEEHDAEYRSIEQAHRRPLRPRHLTLASTRDESRRINDEHGSVIIISAAGMMTGGRVLHHAARLLPDPRATIVFVGYQAFGTPGRYITQGDNQVRIHREWVPIRAHVEQIDGFSGHPDWQEILRWLHRMKGSPHHVYITHGEPDDARAMEGHIHDSLGWTASVPAYGDRVDL